MVFVEPPEIGFRALDQERAILDRICLGIVWSLSIRIKLLCDFVKIWLISFLMA